MLAAAGRPGDDLYLWAVVDEMLARLPAPDPVARALTGVRRNATAIRSLAKGMAARTDIEDSDDALRLFDPKGIR